MAWVQNCSSSIANTLGWLSQMIQSSGPGVRLLNFWLIGWEEWSDPQSWFVKSSPGVTRVLYKIIDITTYQWHALIPPSLKWYHMSAVASQITSNSTVCSTSLFRLTSKKTSQRACHWPFVREIYQWRLGGGGFTNVWRAFKNILSKSMYCSNWNSYEDFNLKLCTCAKSMVLGTHTKFRLEILTINVISEIVYFREIILASSRYVNEKNPWIPLTKGQ